MKYGITKVVGGWDHLLNVEELIPYTLARTHREHKVLRSLLSNDVKRHGGGFREMLEVGSGYGRNLGLLKEFGKNVTGVERDPELADLAQRLYPGSAVWTGENIFPLKFKSSTFDFVLTFTFLQHLETEEARTAANEIARVAGTNAMIVIVEETNMKKVSADCFSRSVEMYRALFPSCMLVHTEPRIVENGLESGTFMVFKKA